MIILVSIQKKREIEKLKKCIAYAEMRRTYEIKTRDEAFIKYRSDEFFMKRIVAHKNKMIAQYDRELKTYNEILSSYKK